MNSFDVSQELVEVIAFVNLLKLSDVYMSQ